MNKEVTYYAGVYNNYTRRVSRVLNISDGVDGLSCEILAKPGVVVHTFSSVRQMTKWAEGMARKLECSHIEINCARGQGSYRWHRVNIARTLICSAPCWL